MRILLTGANGFIGRYLMAGLEAAGHTVVPAVRNPAALNRPDLEALAIDFNRDTSPADWASRLVNIDCVINCAGVLQSTAGQSAEAIHAAAPIALFEAARAAGIRRVIQISAISAEPDAGTEYAETKLAADRHLAGMDLDWVIVRPSLVVAQGAFGGTALMRALAALPLAIPMVGDGSQRFQPVRMEDLIRFVVSLVSDVRVNRQVVDPVGPDVVSFRELLVDYRAWLGLPPAPVVNIPTGLIAPLARLGDVFGGPLSTTALKQMNFGNTGDAAAFEAAAGFRPAGWREGLRQHPAQWQDRWHARLYFFRPLLRWMLALMWLVSGVVGFWHPPALVAQMAVTTGLPHALLMALAAGGCVADIVLGMLVLIRWRPGWLAAIQCALIFGYTVLLSWALPALWIDPFGPLLKNLPILVAIGIWAMLEQER